MSMCLPKVLICGHPEGLVWARSSAEEKFEGLADMIEMTSPNREAFFEDCKTKYAGVVAIYRHDVSSKVIGFFNKELLTHLPPSVRLIAHNGAAYEQIDVSYATARGIAVSYTREATDNAVATATAYLVLSSLRQFRRAEVNLAMGRWKTGLHPAFDPEGRTLGIIGLGGIGSEVARRLAGFNMKVIYHSRHKVYPETFEYCACVDDVLRRADVVSLHIQLSPKTRGFFGRHQFQTMKDGAIFVCTSRGGVVDEDALIEALESGKLYAAGIDLYPEQPGVNPKLLAMDNVTILPQMGLETQDAQRRMELLALDNIKMYLLGRDLFTQVPEQRFPTCFQK